METIKLKEIMDQAQAEIEEEQRKQAVARVKVSLKQRRKFFFPWRIRVTLEPREIPKPVPTYYRERYLGSFLVLEYCGDRDRAIRQYHEDVAQGIVNRTHLPRRK
jgi:hypothetical protein